MRVFLTGATGFIGSALIPELLSHGHQVLGLARSDDGARALEALGADVLRGDLENLDALRRGAEQADGVVHCGFIHDFTKFAQNCEIDRRAIETFGNVLAGSTRPLLVTAGIPALAGRVTTEADAVPADHPMPRVSEQATLALAARGLHASVVRLPQVHDTVRQGLITYAIAAYREKGVCAYVGDGGTRWPAAHVLDVARLYRLAIERAEPGARYHAVAEEGVAFHDIAQTLGRRLALPVASIAPEEAGAYFGWLAMFATHDMAAASAQTREKLKWEPVGPTLLADLERLELGSD